MTVWRTRACHKYDHFLTQISETNLIWKSRVVTTHFEIFSARHLVPILICSRLCKFLSTAVSVCASPQCCKRCQRFQSRQPCESCQSCKSCFVSHRCYVSNTNHDSCIWCSSVNRLSDFCHDSSSSVCDVGDVSRAVVRCVSHYSEKNLASCVNWPVIKFKAATCVMLMGLKASRSHMISCDGCELCYSCLLCALYLYYNFVGVSVFCFAQLRFIAVYFKQRQS